MTAPASPLISVAELAALRARPETAPRLLDVRWSLPVPDGRPAYLAARIPGARFVDLGAELAAPASAAGRHPLPTPEALEGAARSWGLHADEAVVIYDDVAGTSASRAWWLLRDAGVENVRVLDGGLAAWQRAGQPLETGEPAPVTPGTISLGTGHMPRLDADDITAHLATGGVLLDARQAERYRGDIEPIDPRAGHIPGARSAPTTANLDADGLLRPQEELRARFDGLGADDARPLAVSCGSGVTAAHTILTLEHLGRRAALYPGSWSEWSQDTERPVAVGDEPYGTH